MDTARSVGIVGLGYGRAHIPAFQAQGCRVVALCQRDVAQAQAVAAAYGVPQVYARWEDMLEKARPDIVVIATPPHLHRPIALAAFEAGAHVLCEKPLAMDRADAHAMVDAAARAGRVAMTAFNWRFTPAMLRLHALAESGAIGRPFHVAARWFNPRWADETVTPTWRMDRSQAGHGAMGDMGVHLIDLVRWTFGEFVRLTAQAGVAYATRTVPGGARPADADDYCTVLAQLESGTQVTIAVSRVARGIENHHTLEAYGSDGALVYRLDRRDPRWWEPTLLAAGRTGPLARVDVPAIPERGAGDPFDITGRVTIAPLVARLLQAIQNGRGASPSFSDGLAAQAVLDAIVDSARRAAWVDVPR